MKITVVALIVASIGFVLWRSLISDDDRTPAIDRLRSSIDASTLPEQARREMHELIDQRRLRPSQYLEA